MREAAPMPAEGTTVNETVGGPIPPPSITIGTSEQTEEAIMAAAIAATTEVAIALPTTAPVQFPVLCPGSMPNEVTGGLKIPTTKPSP